MQRSNYQLTGKSNSGSRWFTFAGCDWFRKFMSPESFLIESCFFFFFVFLLCFLSLFGSLFSLHYFNNFAIVAPFFTR